MVQNCSIDWDHGGAKTFPPAHPRQEAMPEPETVQREDPHSEVSLAKSPLRQSDAEDAKQDDNTDQRCDYPISNVDHNTGPTEENLVEANPVTGSPSHEDYPLVESTAVIGPSDSERLRHRRRLVLLFSGLILLTTAIAVAVGLGITSPESPSPEPLPVSQSNSPTPWGPPAKPSLHPDFLLFLDSLPNQTRIRLQDENSAQSTAWDWIVKTGLPLNDTQQNLRQRFALACLYFSALETAFDQWILSDLDVCNWDVLACSNTGNVTKIALRGQTLRGTVPPEFYFLTALSDLEMSNNKFYGELLSDLGFLSNLQRLDLTNNNFSGPLPTQLVQLKELLLLDLSSNTFGGTLPTELGQLPKLQQLWLDDNVLEGSVPTEFGQLSQSLELLSLTLNKFTGTIPTELGRLTKLVVLDLSQTSLNGTLPTELGLLSRLTHLALQGTSVQGTVPAELCQLLSANGGLLTSISFECDLVTCSCGCDNCR